MMNIKYLVFDIDGTLTDGKIYMYSDGELMKAIDIKDGYAIYHLSDYGIMPIVITGRESKIVANRCKELKIEMLYQGISDKITLLHEIVKKINETSPEITLDNFAYMGDDIPDKKCMKVCGLAGCPSDAVPSVLEVSDFISPHKAGEGAARDFIEYIIESNNEKNLIEKGDIKERLDKAIEYISNLNYEQLEPGRYDVSPDFYYTVKVYNMPANKVSRYESHKDYVDIQWLCKGIERLYIKDINDLIPSDEYDKEKDIIHYHDCSNMSSMVMQPGSCAILFPKDAHKSESFMGTDSVVKKIIGKLRVV